MYDKAWADPSALTPHDFIDRLKACATLKLGERPSTHQVTNALIKYVMKGRKTDSMSMLALTDELFPSEQEGI